jgi:hypothetical protein
LNRSGVWPTLPAPLDGKMKLHRHSTNEETSPSAPSTAQTAGTVRHGFALQVLLLLISLLIAFAALEIVVRLTESKLERQHPLAGKIEHYYLPQSASTDRDYDYPRAKPPGVFRIVVVGDSFTFGQGVQFDDTFVKRLERMLNLNGTRKVEVINAGMPGYSSMQEVTLVHHAMTEFDPDMVLLEVTLNDPEIKPYEDTHPDVGHYGQPRKVPALFEYFRSLHFLYMRYFSWKQNREYVKYYFRLFAEDETWKPFVGAIAAMKNYAAQSHVKFAAVVFPLFYKSLDENYPFLPIHEKIRSLFQTLHVPLLDLLPSYNHIEPERLHVLPYYDPHPNEIAHRIAADSIYEWMEQMNFLPEELKIHHDAKNRILGSPYLPGESVDGPPH